MSWQAAADGRDWINVMIAAQPVRVMIDLGLVDPAHTVGFEVDPDFYDQLKRAGLLSRFQVRFRLPSPIEVPPFPEMPPVASPR